MGQGTIGASSLTALAIAMDLSLVFITPLSYFFNMCRRDYSYREHSRLLLVGAQVHADRQLRGSVCSDAFLFLWRQDFTSLKSLLCFYLRRLPPLAVFTESPRTATHSSLSAIQKIPLHHTHIRPHNPFSSESLYQVTVNFSIPPSFSS